MLHRQSRISIPRYVCHQIFHLCNKQLRGLMILLSFCKLILNLAQVPKENHKYKNSRVQSVCHEEIATSEKTHSISSVLRGS
jgi:hypothetical protein